VGGVVWAGGMPYFRCSTIPPHHGRPLTEVSDVVVATGEAGDGEVIKPRPLRHHREVW